MASVCILATRGRLNVSTSLVDDEGVDLVFHLPNSVATLAVEMKARMTEGAMVGRGPSKPKSGHRPSRPVRTSTCCSSSSTTRGRHRHRLARPQRRLRGPARTADGGLRFSAAISPASTDKWSPYRLIAAALPLEVVNRLKQLGA